MKINWLGSKFGFEHLNVGQLFRIATDRAQGAVYMKVSAKNPSGIYETPSEVTEYQLEIATGRLFLPTKSPIKVVDAEMNILSDDPGLYE